MVQKVDKNLGEKEKLLSLEKYEYFIRLNEPYIQH
jgi:hypothetical protein